MEFGSNGDPQGYIGPGGRANTVYNGIADITVDDAVLTSNNSEAVYWK